MEMHIASSSTPFPTACTQMILLHLQPGISVKDTSEGATILNQAVDTLKRYPEVRRVYWGVGLETSNIVHLHIVREQLSQHYDFVSSAAYTSLKNMLEGILQAELIVRHAFLVEYTPNCQSLGKGAPFTGTAIYVDTDRAWDFAWQLWATIVPHVKGCMGVAGGYVVEPVNGHKRCFIAWVGWNTIEEHHAYHHTQHWVERRAILQQGNKGYREYCHVMFNNNHPSSKSLL